MGTMGPCMVLVVGVSTLEAQYTLLRKEPTSQRYKHSFVEHFLPRKVSVLP
jgi:hypothetical protein